MRSCWWPNSRVDFATSLCSKAWWLWWLEVSKFCINTGSNWSIIRVAVGQKEIQSSIYPFFCIDHSLDSIRSKIVQKNHSTLKTHGWKSSHDKAEPRSFAVSLVQAAGPPLCGLSRCRHRKCERASLLTGRWCAFAFLFHFSIWDAWHVLSYERSSTLEERETGGGVGRWMCLCLWTKESNSVCYESSPVDLFWDGLDESVV